MYRVESESASSKISVSAACVAIAASVAAIALLLSLHVLSPEFSPAWRMISEYANGQYGWVLSLMFVAYGLGSLALAFAIRSQATTRRGRFGLVMLTLSGIGQVSAAQFDLNQADLHDLAGALGILCLPLAAMLISPTLAGTPRWEAARKPLLITANLTWVSVVLWVGTFGLMIATFLQALGGLPTSAPADLPPGVIALVGWTNRLVVVSAWTWVATVAWHAIKLHNHVRNAPSGTLLWNANDVKRANPA
jgi:hypothetical membrane protein